MTTFITCGTGLILPACMDYQLEDYNLTLIFVTILIRFVIHPDKLKEQAMIDSTSIKECQWEKY